jgi:hypothetical protein
MGHGGSAIFVSQSKHVSDLKIEKHYSSVEQSARTIVETSPHSSNDSLISPYSLFQEDIINCVDKISQEHLELELFVQFMKKGFWRGHLNAEVMQTLVNSSEKWGTYRSSTKFSDNIALKISEDEAALDRCMNSNDNDFEFQNFFSEDELRLVALGCILPSFAKLRRFLKFRTGESDTTKDKAFESCYIDYLIYDDPDITLRPYCDPDMIYSYGMENTEIILAEIIENTDSKIFEDILWNGWEGKFMDFIDNISIAVSVSNNGQTNKSGNRQSRYNNYQFSILQKTISTKRHEFNSANFYYNLADSKTSKTILQAISTGSACKVTMNMNEDNEFAPNLSSIYFTSILSIINHETPNCIISTYYPLTSLKSSQNAFIRCIDLLLLALGSLIQE